MLTKGRVIQLVIMLVILLGAFFWKTFEESPDNKVTAEEKQDPLINLLRCDYVDACEFITDQGEFSLNIKNLPVKAEEWIDLELKVPNESVTVTKAQIVGKTMFMGRIPVTFKKSSAGFSAKTLVGACTTAQMIWLLEITVDNEGVEEIITFDFMVKR